MRIYVHIPAYQSKPFVLYGFQSWPIFDQTKDIFYTFNPDNKFFAIDNDQSFLELSPQEFESCQRINDNIICKEGNIISKGVRKSCLNSLFNSDFQSALAVCKISVEKTSERVISLKNNQFVSISKNPISVEMKCSNGTKIHFQIPPNAKFTLQPQCYLETKLFRIFGSIQSDHSLVSHYTWPLDSLSDIFKDLDRVAIENMIQVITNKTLPPVNANILKALNDMNQSHTYTFVSQWPFLSVSSVTIFLFVLLAIGSLIMCVRKCKKVDYKNVNQQNS